MTGYVGWRGVGGGAGGGGEGKGGEGQVRLGGVGAWIELAGFCSPKCRPGKHIERFACPILGSTPQPRIDGGEGIYGAL